MTDNDKQVGERWDEDEDWGSLEVRRLHFDLTDRRLSKNLFKELMSDIDY